MTREEAIHELQEDKWLYETEVCHAGDGTPDGRLLEALDMAIEALKQVTGKLNNPDDSFLTADSEACKEQKSKLDLISREAATSIPILPKEHRKVFKGEDDAFETGWNEALACVNMLPSADRPKGEWIDRKEEVDGFLFIGRRCSNCDWWENGGYNLPFCPNCGADMRERSDE